MIHMHRHSLPMYTHTHTWCSLTNVMCVAVGMALLVVVVRHLEFLICPLARSSHTPGPVDIQIRIAKSEVRFHHSFQVAGTLRAMTYLSPMMYSFHYGSQELEGRESW